MSLIGPPFFILGWIMALAIADETTTNRGLFTNTQGSSKPLNDNSKFSLTTEMPLTNNEPLNDNNTFILTTEMPFTNTTMNITSTTSDMNITNPNSITTLATTKQKGVKTTEGGKNLITPKSVGPAKTTSASNKGKKNVYADTDGYNTGIYVLIVIIIVAVGLGVVCYFVRNRGRRQSVDFTSRQDEANIPLSFVDAELPVDTISHNGLQTFETTKTPVKEPQEPETKPEGQEDQKRDSKSVAAEADKSAAPSPLDTEDKPKEDVAKPSATPAPVQPSSEEKTDDEGASSNKTSVESLKETNENNSNNADFRQKRNLDSSNFWTVPLDSPV